MKLIHIFARVSYAYGIILVGLTLMGFYYPSIFNLFMGTLLIILGSVFWEWRG